jgi:hypothetical protein
MLNRTSVIFTGLLLGSAANMLMQTLVATVLPQIIDQLGGHHLYSWVFKRFLFLQSSLIPMDIRISL